MAVVRTIDRLRTTRPLKGIPTGTDLLKIWKSVMATWGGNGLSSMASGKNEFRPFVPPKNISPEGVL